jgi:HSP20 family protein
MAVAVAVARPRGALIWRNPRHSVRAIVPAVSLPPEEAIMAQTASNVPVKVTDKTPASSAGTQIWSPFDNLRGDFNRLFDDFSRDLWRRPFSRSAFDMLPCARTQLAAVSPAVDVVEKPDAFEITAELPGMDEKNIEVKLVNGSLTVKGEKEEKKEEKKKDYHLRERYYGAFERSFAIPEGVDTDKIEANFNKGVLTLRLPKKPDAIKPEKTIAVKAG